jgi:hypothetical protein
MPVLVFERQILVVGVLFHELEQDIVRDFTIIELTLQSTPIGFRHESHVLAKLLS